MTCNTNENICRCCNFDDPILTVDRLPRKICRKQLLNLSKMFPTNNIGFQLQACAFAVSTHTHTHTHAVIISSMCEHAQHVQQSLRACAVMSKVAKFWLLLCGVSQSRVGSGSRMAVIIFKHARACATCAVIVTSMCRDVKNSQMFHNFCVEFSKAYVDL